MTGWRFDLSNTIRGKDWFDLSSFCFIEGPNREDDQCPEFGPLTLSRVPRSTNQLKLDHLTKFGDTSPRGSDSRFLRNFNWNVWGKLTVFAFVPSMINTCPRIPYNPTSYYYRFRVDFHVWFLSVPRRLGGNDLKFQVSTLPTRSKSG